MTTVAGRLGHTDATTTLSIYAHFVEASDREAAQTIAHVLAKPRVIQEAEHQGLHETRGGLVREPDLRLGYPSDSISATYSGLPVRVVKRVPPVSEASTCTAASPGTRGRGTDTPALVSKSAPRSTIRMSAIP